MSNSDALRLARTADGVLRVAVYGEAASGAGAGATNDPLTLQPARLVLALSATNNGTLATIAVIRGMGGTGKSELAYAVARQLREAFPDAQLLVELRGAIGNPLTPEQTLQTVRDAREGKGYLG